MKKRIGFVALATVASLAMGATPVFAATHGSSTSVSHSASNGTTSTTTSHGSSSNTSTGTTAKPLGVRTASDNPRYVGNVLRRLLKLPHVSATVKWTTKGTRPAKGTNHNVKMIRNELNKALATGMVNYIKTDESGFYQGNGVVGNTRLKFNLQFAVTGSDHPASAAFSLHAQWKSGNKVFVANVTGNNGRVETNTQNQSTSSSTTSTHGVTGTTGTSTNN